MASKYSIEAVFKLIDKISAPLDRVAGKGNAVSKALKRDFISAQKTLDNAGQSLKKFGGYAAVAGVAAVGVGLGIATKQFIEFDNAVTAASAKFKDVDLTTPEGLVDYQRVLKEAGKTAREVAAITEYNAVDTSGALDKMAMAGLTSNQSMKLLMGTTNLATAAGMDLTTAVDIATDSLGAFGLMSKDISEDQLAANLDRVSDVMAKTTNMFNTDMSMMFEAVQKGAPAFTAAGQQIEEFSAMIGVLASSGIKGGEAGTQLRNMILSLSAPVDKAQEAMDRLGISVSDSNGNFRNVLDILGQFETAFGEDVAKEFKKQVSALENIDGVSMEDQISSLYEKFSAGMVGNTEKIADLNTIFGKRTVTSMLLLLAEGSAGLKDYTEQLQNAGGTSQKIADAMRGSIKNKIEVLKSALTELGFKFIEAFQEKGSGIIVKLTDAITNFDPAPMISALTATAAVVEKVIKTVWSLRHIILGVAIAWGIYKSAMLAAAAVSQLMTLIKAVKMLASGQKVATVAQWAFNAALTANPIGLIVVAIGILIGLLVLAYQKCEPFRNAVNGVFEKLKALGAHILQVLSPAFEVIKGIVEKVKNVFGEIIGTIGRVISILFNLFNITGNVSGAFSWFDTILKAWTTGAQVAWTIIGGLVDILGTLFSGINDVIDAFSNDGFLAGIKQIGASLLRYMLVPIKTILDAVSFLPGIGDIAKKAADKIGSFQESLRYEQPKDITNPTATTPAEVVNTAAPAAETAIPRTPPATPPAIANAVPAPVSSNSRSDATQVHQATLLDLSSPMSNRTTIPASAAASISTETAASTETVTRTPAVPRSVNVPVNYIFSELIVPPELINPVSVPVHFDYLMEADTSPAGTVTETAGIPPVPSAIFSPVNIPVNFAFPETNIPSELIKPVSVPVDYVFTEFAIPPDILNSIAIPVKWELSAMPPQAITQTTSPITPVSESIGESITPPVAPMTQAEQIIYSRTDHYENVHIAVSPEDGARARIIKEPQSPNISVTVSGGV